MTPDQWLGAAVLVVVTGACVACHRIVRSVMFYADSEGLEDALAPLAEDSKGATRGGSRAEDSKGASTGGFRRRLGGFNGKSNAAFDWESDQ